MLVEDELGLRPDLRIHTLHLIIQALLQWNRATIERKVFDLNNEHRELQPVVTGVFVVFILVFFIFILVFFVFILVVFIFDLVLFAFSLVLVVPIFALVVFIICISIIFRFNSVFSVIFVTFVRALVSPVRSARDIRGN